MPHLLDLPRELRDMIYLAILSAERPLPTYTELFGVNGQRAIYHDNEINDGFTHGFIFQPVGPPETCGKFMACNRQIYEEMKEAIRLAKKSRQGSLKLDCVLRVPELSWYHVNWRRIPYVRTTTAGSSGINTRRVWAKICQRWYLSHQSPARTSSTFIDQLWLDVRVASDKREGHSAAMPPGREPRPNNCWSILSALKYIVTFGPNFRKTAMVQSAHAATIDDLVLNVVDTPTTTKGEPPNEENGANGANYAQAKAKELIEMWNELWTQPAHLNEAYIILLERINRVRVCVNGQTVRVRELAPELERGREERRRIAAREGF